MPNRISFAIKAAVIAVIATFIWYCSAHSAKTAELPQPAFSAEGLEFFEKKIRPVLADNCYACHSATAKKPAGGLLLDRFNKRHLATRATDIPPLRARLPLDRRTRQCRQSDFDLTL